MKILMTNTGPWGTGSFSTIDSLTKELTERKHQVKVFFPAIKAPDSSTKMHSDENYNIWEFPITHNEINIPSFPLMIPDPHPCNPNPITFKALTQDQLDLYLLSFKEHITPLIETFKPDIVESNHIWAMGYALAKMNIPFINVAHNSDQLGFEFDERIRPYATFSAQHAQYIFAFSQKTVTDVMRLYHVPEEKIVLMPHGYDSDTFKPASVDRKALLKTLGLNIPEDAPVINLTGKISRIKGIDILLKANKLLNKSLNAHCLILGSGSIDQLELSKDELDACDFNNIHFLGHQDATTVAKIHNISRCSLAPSRSESGPISAIEAMGCGIPIIISKLDAVDRDAAGFVIDQESPAQLAEKIETLLTLSQPEYDALCRQALVAAKKFSWEDNANIRLAYYEKILSKK